MNTQIRPCTQTLEVDHLDEEDNQLENSHEDIGAEDSQSEGMLCLTESDEISDAIDISDAEELSELQSMLIPTESTMDELPVSRLCEPSLEIDKSESSFLISTMTPLTHVQPLKELASSSNEKPIHHSFTLNRPVRSQLYVHSDVQEKMIDQTLGDDTSNEVIVRCFSIALRRHDMRTLNNSVWLNDQVS